MPHCWKSYVTAHIKIEIQIFTLHWMMQIISFLMPPRSQASQTLKSPMLCINQCKLKSVYNKTCLKRPLKKNTIIFFQDRLLLNAGQKYCRMLQGEHSAILSTFMKLPFVIKIFFLSIFEWPLKTGFNVIDRLWQPKMR